MVATVRRPCVHLPRNPDRSRPVNDSCLNWIWV